MVSLGAGKAPVKEGGEGKGDKRRAQFWEASSGGREEEERSKSSPAEGDKNR
jgi:hypothetical protein